MVDTLDASTYCLIRWLYLERIRHPFVVFLYPYLLNWLNLRFGPQWSLIPVLYKLREDLHGHEALTSRPYGIGQGAHKLAQPRLSKTIIFPHSLYSVVFFICIKKKKGTKQNAKEKQHKSSLCCSPNWPKMNGIQNFQQSCWQVKCPPGET